jgi:hypothetical protein
MLASEFHHEGAKDTKDVEGDTVTDTGTVAAPRLRQGHGSGARHLEGARRRARSVATPWGLRRAVTDSATVLHGSDSDSGRVSSQRL